MDIPAEIAQKIEDGERIILMPIGRPNGQRAWLSAERVSDSFFQIAMAEPDSESIGELRMLNHTELATLLSELTGRTL